MRNAIQLHQTLHGYGDGHQLLASSLSLSRDQQWQLLVMSDLSGHSFRPGFDSYLTGYPLENAGFYCLARTWFAPELPRPGCVWTHTILISDTDVAQISDFRSVLSHFRRPSSSKDVEDYKVPIQVGSGPLADTTYELDSNVARMLLSLLYGSPFQRIVLVSESSRPYEQLVIALLSQQWPRLRRTFKFCTGALAIRDLNFDLAVAPPNALRQSADGQKTITARPNDTGLMSEQMEEDWIRVASDDLAEPNPEAMLRRFLWRFGPDYGDGRNVFRPLCEIYLASSRSSDCVDQVLAATSHFFPEANSSQRLKAEFFGKGGTFSQIPRQGEPSVLMALVTHPAATSIPSDVAAIAERARSLVSTDLDSALKIAAAALSVGGIRGGQYLDGFAAGVQRKPEILHTLPSSLTYDLFKRLPSLLSSSQAWQGSIEYQLALAAHISSLDTAGDLRREVTKAILTANAWAPLTSILTQFGDDAIRAILDWIDVMPETSLSIPQQVFDSLAAQRHRVTEAIHQKQFGARALRVASAFLDPRSERVQALGTRGWMMLAASGIRLASAQAELRSKAFALSLGLSLSGNGDVRLVREGFSAVYDAAREQRLDEEMWSFVEPYLPWYVITWDRCVRLIRGVVRLFVERQWPAPEFVSTFLTAEQFQHAMDEASSTRAGLRYIKGICDLTTSNSEVVDDVHSRILQHYCRPSNT